MKLKNFERMKWRTKVQEIEVGVIKFDVRMFLEWVMSSKENCVISEKNVLPWKKCVILVKVQT